MLQSSFLRHLHPSSRAALLAAVAGMGFLGATCRYALQSVIPDGGISISTLIINVVGCYALPFVNEWLSRRLHLPRIFCSALGVGFVGSFTTLSAIELNVFTFLVQGAYVNAALEMTITLVTTLLATAVGHYTCALLAQHRLERLRRERVIRHEHTGSGDRR